MDPVAFARAASRPVVTGDREVKYIEASWPNTPEVLAMFGLVTEEGGQARLDEAMHILWPLSAHHFGVDEWGYDSASYWRGTDGRHNLRMKLVKISN